MELPLGGYRVTAVDMVASGVEQGQARAIRAGVPVDFRVGYLCSVELGGYRLPRRSRIAHQTGTFRGRRRSGVGAFEVQGIRLRKDLLVGGSGPVNRRRPRAGET